MLYPRRAEWIPLCAGDAAVGQEASQPDKTRPRAGAVASARSADSKKFPLGVGSRRPMPAVPCQEPTQQHLKEAAQLLLTRGLTPARWFENATRYPTSPG